MRSATHIDVRHEDLIPLKPVLEKWTELVQKYSDTFPNESACYWFNERANVSVLAAAGWSAAGNWLALEEFSTLKHTESAPSSNGRCDLWVHDNITDTSFAFEAKQVWQGVGDRVADLYQNTREGLKASLYDASRLRKDEADVRVGLAFIVPKYPVSQGGEGGAQQRVHGDGEWLAGLAALSCDAIAWVFPDTSKGLVSAGGYLFPGVCLVLNVRKRAMKIAKSSD